MCWVRNVHVGCSLIYHYILFGNTARVTLNQWLFFHYLSVVVVKSKSLGNLDQSITREKKNQQTRNEGIAHHFSFFTFSHFLSIFVLSNRNNEMKFDREKSSQQKKNIYLYSNRFVAANINDVQYRFFFSTLSVIYYWINVERKIGFY